VTNAEARCNKSLRPRKPEGSLGRTAQDVHLDSHTAPELWVWGKWDKLFKALKDFKLSGVCESLWILWSSERYGKTISLSVRNCIPQDQMVVSTTKIMQNHKECTSYQFWLIVHRPSAIVRVAPLYQMCGRVAHLHVAFPCHIAKVCEKCEF